MGRIVALCTVGDTSLSNNGCCISFWILRRKGWHRTRSPAAIDAAPNRHREARPYLLTFRQKPNALQQEVRCSDKLPLLVYVLRARLQHIRTAYHRGLVEQAFVQDPG